MPLNCSSLTRKSKHAFQLNIQYQGASCNYMLPYFSLFFSDWYIPSDSFSSRIGAFAARKSQSKWVEHSSHYVSRLLCCYSAPSWWTDGHKHWPGISWSPECWEPTPRVPTSCLHLRVLRRVTTAWCVEGTIPGYLLFHLSPLLALEDSRPPTSQGFKKLRFTRWPSELWT